MSAPPFDERPSDGAARWAVGACEQTGQARAHDGSRVNAGDGAASDGSTGDDSAGGGSGAGLDAESGAEDETSRRIPRSC